MSYRLTTEEFIEQARAAHGDRYDYSGVRYVNNKTKIEIICPKHGSFLQIPNGHISQKQGCPNCAGTKQLTTTSFINKAHKIHQDKYDYSKTHYVNNKNRVEIICSTHGSFWQRPSNHISQKQGCPNCGIELTTQKNTLTVFDFIEQANKIHNSKYEYSKVDYQNSKFKVEIICLQHGSFWQIPNSHLRGRGCPICGGKKQLSTLDFIKRAQGVHRDKFDYSKVKYKTNKDKVEIICPKHGNFWQTPNEHIKGKTGCTACGVDSRVQKQTLTTSDFIKRAKKVHGNKYDYSRVDYQLGKSKVEIACSKHGRFWQRPQIHIKASGCPVCAIELSAQKRTLTTSEFIERAKKIHGDKYDYSKVEYIGGKAKVKIICRKHGIFRQTPNHHLREVNCPACQSSKGEQYIADLLTRWQIPFTRQKRFDACKDKIPLPFDFYFQLGKLYFLVEFDGPQHFQAIDHWGGVETLTITQHHDAIKNRFIADYGFVLIRISYTQYDNIETILKTAIKKHTDQSLTTVSEKLLLPPQTRPTIDPGQWTQLNLF